MDAGPKPPYSLGERQMLMLHGVAYGIAMPSATETVVVTIGIDYKGWSPLVMKRTASGMPRTGRLESDRFANELGKIGQIKYFLYCSG